MAPGPLGCGNLWERWNKEVKLKAQIRQLALYRYGAGLADKPQK